MNEKEMASILTEQGWVCNKDEVGDCFCVIDVGDTEIQVIPSVGKRTDHFRVSLRLPFHQKNFQRPFPLYRAMVVVTFRL